MATKEFNKLATEIGYTAAILREHEEHGCASVLLEYWREYTESLPDESNKDKAILLLFRALDLAYHADQYPSDLIKQVDELLGLVSLVKAESES